MNDEQLRALQAPLKDRYRSDPDAALYWMALMIRAGEDPRFIFRRMLISACEDVGLAAGYGIVRGYVGHGIGNEMHEEPQVTNYRTGRRGRKIEPGLCIAIEPMFTIGSYETRVKSDGWTVATADGSLAAHWEHSIAITADGPRVRTRAEGETIEGRPTPAGASA